MASEPASKSGVLFEISQQLGTIFRHTFPGILLVGGARLAYPDSFRSLQLESWPHLVVLVVITVTLGNVLFALNRYGVHQLFEYVLYLFYVKGPVRKHGDFDYIGDLGSYAFDSLKIENRLERARQHVSFRISTALLLLTLGECAIFFALSHSQSSALKGHGWQLGILGVASIPAYLWQTLLAKRIDYLIVTTKPAAEAENEIDSKAA